MKYPRGRPEPEEDSAFQITVIRGVEQKKKHVSALKIAKSGFEGGFDMRISNFRNFENFRNFKKFQTIIFFGFLK